MVVRALTLNPAPVAVDIYETAEITFSSLNAPGDYTLIIDVPVADASDPAKGFTAELLWWDDAAQEWVGGGGMSQPAFAATPAINKRTGLPGPVQTRFTCRSAHQRETFDILGTRRKAVLDLMWGKRAKVRIEMPVLLALGVSVDHRAVVDAQKADRVLGKPVPRVP